MCVDVSNEYCWSVGYIVLCEGACEVYTFSSKVRIYLPDFASVSYRKINFDKKSVISVIIFISPDCEVKEAKEMSDSSD